MRIGQLRHRINIQSRVNTQNATTGENVVTWAAFLTDEPAQINSVSAREFIQSSAEQNQTMVKMIVRYQAGYSPTMRVVWESENYEIQGILQDETARGYLTLMCSKGLSDGQ